MTAIHIVHLCHGMMVSLLLLPMAESKRCMKREEIGNRVNNFYECNHPVLNECCEHGNRFTCCEPTFSKTIREQLQLWGIIVVMVVVGAMIYSCIMNDKDFIRSDTLKEAVGKVGRKFGIGKKERPGVINKGATGKVEDSDQCQLTDNIVDNTATTSFTSCGDMHV